MPTPQTLNHNQATVGTSATPIVPANPNRKAATIVLKGTAPVETFIGGAGVTTANGCPVPAIAGASITIETGAAIYGIVAAGSQVVGYIETSD